MVAHSSSRLEMPCVRSRQTHARNSHRQLMKRLRTTYAGCTQQQPLNCLQAADCPHSWLEGEESWTCWWTGLGQRPARGPHTTCTYLVDVPCMDRG